MKEARHTVVIWQNRKLRVGKVGWLLHSDLNRERRSPDQDPQVLSLPSTLHSSRWPSLGWRVVSTAQVPRERFNSNLGLTLVRLQEKCRCVRLGQVLLHTCCKGRWRGSQVLCDLLQVKGEKEAPVDLGGKWEDKRGSLLLKPIKEEQPRAKYPINLTSLAAKISEDIRECNM